VVSQVEQKKPGGLKMVKNLGTIDAPISFIVLGVQDALGLNRLGKAGHRRKPRRRGFTDPGHDALKRETASSRKS